MTHLVAELSAAEGAGVGEGVELWRCDRRYPNNHVASPITSTAPGGTPIKNILSEG